MSEITQFQTVLPPAGARFRGRPFTPPPSRASAGGLIVNALAPLRGPLDAALAAGDRETALQLAYQALAQVADALAQRRGDKAQPWQTLIHALLVELTPLPYAPRPDGTLVDLDKFSKQFPRIPHVNLPTGCYQPFRLDFGSQWLTAGIA